MDTRATGLLALAEATNILLDRVVVSMSKDRLSLIFGAAWAEKARAAWKKKSYVILVIVPGWSWQWRWEVGIEGD